MTTQHRAYTLTVAMQLIHYNTLGKMTVLENDHIQFPNWPYGPEHQESGEKVSKLRLH